MPRTAATDGYPLRAIHSDRPSSRTAACPGPCRISADAVITTSAPASRYLITSAGPSTPVVAAREARKCWCRMEIQVRGSRASAGLERYTSGTIARVAARARFICAAILRRLRLGLGREVGQGLGESLGARLGQPRVLFGLMAQLLLEQGVEHHRADAAVGQPPDAVDGIRERGCRGDE